MSISEKITLLGKGLYKDIPDELTLHAIPTASELDYVGAEDFHDVMLNKILPQVIEEDIDPKKLFELDYYWVLRCLRFINYGPYTNVGGIYCSDCGEYSQGEYMVDLRTVECIPIPEGFVNKHVISKDEFISFNDDIEVHLPTIQDIQNSSKDKMFQDAQGNVNRRFARICYMIDKIGNLPVDTVTVRMKLQKELEPADYAILADAIKQFENYGLRSGGTVKCPACNGPNGKFITFIDERFFRPDVDCLRKWRDDKRRRESENVSRVETRGVKSIIR